ncbi:Phosphoribosyltransferase C-terminal [Dillenia turbinata]|uniref:Phosphoribosyltransferase C-terminal n=1 Tax=Dillenia turbinata TaxID=194707 RepID=A0AAN8VL95_9MAGN
MYQANHQAYHSEPDDYKLKDTNPQLGERWPNGVAEEDMKAKDLPPSATTASCDPYVEVKLGNYKGKTRHFEKKMNPEWNQVFAFSKVCIQSSVLEVFVKDKEMVGRDEYLGRVVFDMNEVPIRFPPDSPLAPQWYKLEDRRGQGKVRGEIMLAAWMGTQADEAFPKAWYSDTAPVYGEGVFNVHSNVYVSPKWYLRVNIIVAQGILPNDRSRLPDVFAKVQIGTQTLRTQISPICTTNPLWNEDLVFVVAEPLEEHMLLTIEDHVHASRDDVLGQIILPIETFEKRHPCISVVSWKPTKERNSTGWDFGGGHYKCPRASSDEDERWQREHRCLLRCQVWPEECSRTILDSFCPKLNEQYTWEVYVPSTVKTLGVFDNCHLSGGERPVVGGARDSIIGKVSVIYPRSLPDLHSLLPSSINQIETLRYQAMNIVASRLGRAEPPLREEVVEYMLDVDSHVWSMRRSKANFFRIMSLLSGTITVGRWFSAVCHWKNPIISVLVRILFRPRHPPHMDTKLSWAEAVSLDELDEEFDTFPTSRNHDIVRMRYDRLRSVAGRIQTVVGDLATQGERLQSLLSWRDPRVTRLFIALSLCAAVVLYVTPFRAVALVSGLYMLRHPRFRSKLPSAPSNFSKPLTARTDSLL